MLKVALPPLVIMNRAGDKEAARKEWRARFNNRTPAERQPKALTVRAADADVTEILLYDEIGFWGITAKEFATGLAGVTTPSIVLRINSPGGDVFDGLAMYNALLSHGAKVTTVVDGLAASAASFIALAGDTIQMHESAMMMVHRAWGLAIGNEGDMAAMADTLRKIDAQLAGIYAKKTGETVEEMLAMMAGEADGTWFTADEAKAAGMIDEVLVGEPAGNRNSLDIGAEAAARLQAMRRRLALAEQD